MVHEKANEVVEQLYDAILGSLASWRKDSEKDEDQQISFLDKQVVIGSMIDAFSQLVSVDIGLAKK